MNTVKELVSQGQSVWQDDISRKMIQNGELQRAIDETGIRGVTSNPTIFQKAIAAGDTYDADLTQLLADGNDAAAAFQTVAVKDIQDACDLFRPLYDETGGEDGYVSLEVLPALARDTQGTLDNAYVLWKAVDRPNLMIKVPGTKEGVTAVEKLLTDGINVNVTLLFSIDSYINIAHTYISALQKRHDNGLSVDRIASVASFFVSRVDTLADKLIDQKLAEGGDAELLNGLKGKVAVANAILAYEQFTKIFGSEEFKVLADAGAKVQRPLWASTGTKNPDYSDVLYVDSLIGPDTVNTAPTKTIEAFLDHGTVARTIDVDFAAAHKVLDDLKAAGIKIEDVTRQLEEEGINSFMASYDELLEGVESKR